jgi:hypothetical protein
LPGALMLCRDHIARYPTVIDEWKQTRAEYNANVTTDLEP